MRKRTSWWVGVIGLVAMAAAGCSGGESVTPVAERPGPSGGTESGEVHLTNLRQLTFGGENAEAYFAFDGSRLIFQTSREDVPCDQIYTMDLDGTNVQMVSTGDGRTTCGYFFPDGESILYASTHLGSPDCPPPPSQSEGYVWAIYPTFDIFSANRDGSDIKRLTSAQGYDAEGTISTDGKKIVFTSARDGDLELYEMNIDGTGQRRLTHELGYDGGAWHSQDGQWIVWRANRPRTPEEIARYRDLFARNLVMPARMELMIMRSDGSEKKQIYFLSGHGERDIDESATNGYAAVRSGLEGDNYQVQTLIWRSTDVDVEVPEDA
ncbi:MAG: PD40 domain-containing protein, partial [Acidobacteria bacterium]|nr:PD40 domain-containing protein [Acidobacteriota bacterium]